MLKKVLKNLFIVAVTAVSWLSALAARAEQEDWLPDSDKWGGEQSRGFLGRLRVLLGNVVSGIRKAVDGVIAFFQKIWNFFVDLFKSLLQLIADVWNWVFETFIIFTDWLADTYEAFLEWFLSTIESLWETICEYVDYIGETLFEFLLTMMDWAIGVVVTTFEWVIDQIPKIELPKGFEDGMQYFIQYGMMLDSIAPFSETLAWFVTYVTILTVVAAYRIVKSYIPFIQT